MENKVIYTKIDHWCIRKYDTFMGSKYSEQLLNKHMSYMIHTGSVLKNYNKTEIAL